MLGLEQVRRSSWAVGSFALGLALLTLFVVADLAAPHLLKPKVYFVDVGGRLVVLQRGMPFEEVCLVLNSNLQEHAARFGGDTEAFAASPALQPYVFRFREDRLQSVLKSNER